MTQKHSVTPVKALPTAIQDMPPYSHTCTSNGIRHEKRDTAEPNQLGVEVVTAMIKCSTVPQEDLTCCCGCPRVANTGAATGVPFGLPEACVALELLSRTERIVLSQLALGLRVAEIASNLSRSPKTVSTQKMSIMRKLGVGTDFELHRMISQLNLDEGPQCPPRSARSQNSR